MKHTARTGIRAALALFAITLAAFIGAAFMVAIPTAATAGDIATLAPSEGGGHPLRDATNLQSIQEVYPRGWTCQSFAASASVLSGTSTVIDIDTIGAASSDYVGPYLVKIQNTHATSILGYYVNSTSSSQGDGSTVVSARLQGTDADNPNDYTELLLAPGQYLHLRTTAATGSAATCVCHLDD